MNKSGQPRYRLSVPHRTRALTYDRLLILCFGGQHRQIRASITSGCDEKLHLDRPRYTVRTYSNLDQAVVVNADQDEWQAGGADYV